MSERSSYPTFDEFFERLEVRKVQTDLRDELRSRVTRERGSVHRVGSEATVVAVASRILPGDVPPKALAVFLDQTFDKQMGRSDEKRGLMPRAELVPTGFRLIDEEAIRRHGTPFAELAPDRQDTLLGESEKGSLKGPEGFDSAAWFNRVRESFLLAFGSDPRGMVQMGFPGPSYQPGHVWLDPGEVKARTARKRGYLEL